MKNEGKPRVYDILAKAFAHPAVTAVWAPAGICLAAGN